MKGKIAFVLGAAIGYVLGARAGRKRYEQIKAGAEKVWNTAPVQAGATQVKGFLNAQGAAAGSVAGDTLRHLVSLIVERITQPRSRAVDSRAADRDAATVPPGTPSPATPEPQPVRSSGAPGEAIPVGAEGSDSSTPATPADEPVAAPQKPAAKKTAAKKTGPRTGGPQPSGPKKGGPVRGGQKPTEGKDKK
ncbi:hypothetical protein GCM10022198_03040 [Klugiella xanthotipulae]|uniref:YtxH-like protein n=1 Tax=Klugiella xanthotipulae TaxID=244735 RepID=A0A543I7C7_9MICO|nr:hypothetical protein [Klugiella xanthotipulae]TQM66400.1 hypothetical protein FB466_1240 [Klugiella xanthotipulae]